MPSAPRLPNDTGKTENGVAILEGDPTALKNDDRIRQAYLGM